MFLIRLRGNFLALLLALLALAACSPDIGHGMGDIAAPGTVAARRARSTHAIRDREPR